MALPAAAVAAGLARRRLAPAIAALATSLGAVALVLLVGAIAAIFGLEPAQPGGHGASQLALREIPPRYLALYQQAGRRYRIDPWILAAVGWVETQHGQLKAAGVRSGVNEYGCCGGPMQFWIAPPHPNTWDMYGVDGNHDGTKDPHDPADAIPAAARYLRASGAPLDYRKALFAYNRADWYVEQVLAKAATYRGAPRPGAEPLRGGSATVRELLANPRVTLSPVQRADLQAGGIDPRTVAVLAAIGRRHRIVVTSLQSDHAPGTNHQAGRAFDIGAVDGEICRGARSGPCAQLVRSLAAMRDKLRATELIYCWDPDGAADPRGFARSDHCDHIHAGWDA